MEVSFDTESFSLDFTATILAPGIMRDMDLEEITDGEKLVDSMGELTEASAQLTDGVGELSPL